ncbi:MAG: hypothetical protein GF307_08385 [candidate division Zixibacteria bacterium]|nr:hypothetical protein [candidate division Zixibacteria bacterium]
MSFIEGINRFFSIYIDVFKGLGRVKILLPMFLYALAQCILLYAMVSFYKEPFDGLMVPLLSRLFGNEITHYPAIFQALASIFGYLTLPVSFILSSLLTGMAVFLFASFFEDEGLSISAAFKSAISKYHILLLLWILETAVILALITIPSQFAGDFFQYSLKRQLVFRLMLAGLGAFGTAVFAYTTASAVLGRTSFIKAIISSLRIFKENFFTTFFIVLVPVMIRFPIDFINSKSAQYSGKFNPEFIAVLVLIGIIVSYIANLFLVGGVTRVYVSERS